MDSSRGATNRQQDGNGANPRGRAPVNLPDGDGDGTDDDHVVRGEGGVSRVRHQWNEVLSYKGARSLPEMQHNPCQGPTDRRAEDGGANNLGGVALGPNRNQRRQGPEIEQVVGAETNQIVQERGMARQAVEPGVPVHAQVRLPLIMARTLTEAQPVRGSRIDLDRFLSRLLGLSGEKLVPGAARFRGDPAANGRARDYACGSASS